MTAYMARANRLPPAERDSQLREISTPVLIITGDTNAMVEVAVAKRYAELIPRNEFEIWKDTRHMVQEQRPERVIAAIHRWASDSP